MKQERVGTEEIDREQNKNVVKSRERDGGEVSGTWIAKQETSPAEVPANPFSL